MLLSTRSRTLLVLMCCSLVASFALLSFTTLSAQAAPVIYVVPGGAGTQDGSSWANARDLQAALTAAVAPAELWVKAGTYTPTTSMSREATFALKNGVAIYGGFAGTETAREQRNWEANVTTLSGEIGTSSAADNSYHVVTSMGNSADTILDGVTVQQGTTNVPAMRGFCNDTCEGGGMRNTNSSPTLTNVTFIDNRGTFGGGMYNAGGNPTLTNVTFVGNGGSGMYNAGNSTLTNVTFVGNDIGMHNGGGNPTLTNVTFAGNGSGMSNSGGNPTLTNVTITGNRVYGMGNGYSNPTLTNVTITGNGASGMYNKDSMPTLINVTITGNGGGMYIGSGMYNERSSPTLTNVTIAGNTGDGMSNTGSSPTLTNVTFAGNTGSGMYNTGGSPTLTNVTIVGNTGGGMSNKDSMPTLTNVTITGNGGTGMYNESNWGPAALIIKNSIIWGNAGGIINARDSSADIQYSNVQDMPPDESRHILSIDPQFVAPIDYTTAPTTTGNLRLQASSPLIDTGNTSFLPAGVTSERDGYARLVGAAVDMGAYEWQGPNESTPGPTATNAPTSTATATATATSTPSPTTTVTASPTTAATGVPLATAVATVTSTATSTVPTTSRSYLPLVLK